MKHWERCSRATTLILGSQLRRSKHLIRRNDEMNLTIEYLTYHFVVRLLFFCDQSPRGRNSQGTLNFRTGDRHRKHAKAEVAPC